MCVQNAGGVGAGPSQEGREPAGPASRLSDVLLMRTRGEVWGTQLPQSSCTEPCSSQLQTCADTHPTVCPRSRELQPERFRERRGPHLAARAKALGYGIHSLKAEGVPG